MDETNVWNSILAAVEKRINHESFTAWFKPISFLDSDDAAIRLRAPDHVFEDWILITYRDVFEEAMEEAGVAGIAVHFEVHSPGQDVPKTEIRPQAAFAQKAGASSKPAAIPHVQVESVTAATRSVDTESTGLPLNQKYTFDNFVVGESNKFAHAAAMAVAESPSKSYNPFCIYGGVGLGKTHLMCSIGHKIKEQNRHLRLAYISSEEFTNQFTNAIRNKQTDVFRQKYRSIDVLLIDDIQFLASKPGTQEELFHTFNALHNEQKQIVVSSDCLPSEIPDFEERLHSRFAWGLIADIQPPDLETKVAILHKKAESEKLDIPDEFVVYIAKKIKSNIRELEGSLVRLMALSSLTGVPISRALAQEAIKHISEDDQTVSIETIQKVVAKRYDLNVTDLKSKAQSHDIAFPRHVAMYLCKTLTKNTLEKIGREFGKRHHTTVLSSIQKISKLYDQPDDFHKTINNLIDSCQ